VNVKLPRGIDPAGHGSAGILGSCSLACAGAQAYTIRESIERFLRHQNLWTKPLGLAEARPAPCFRSITRLKPTRQVELFE